LLLLLYLGWSLSTL